MSRRWPLVWALLVVSSGCYFLSGNEADNDLWVHVRVGLDVLETGPPRSDPYSYTAAAGPWIDHEWLLHALFGALYQSAGSRGLLLFKLVFGAATLALLALSVSRRSASPHVRGAVLVLTVAVLARGFAVRPQVVTYAGLAALWAFLDSERRDTVWRWLLVPAFAFWANVHGAVVLAVGATAACAAWTTAGKPREGLLLGLAASFGVAAALVLNPYGFAYGGYLGNELGAPHPITEWQPVAFEAAQGSFLLMAAAFLLSLPFFRGWRERGWQPLLAGGLLAAAFLQQRHTPVFAIFAAPVIAEGADNLVARLRRSPGLHLSGGAQRILVLGMVVVALLQLGSTAQRLARDRLEIVFEPSDYPVAAVRRLEAARVAGNLAVPLEWGGYALWHLSPDVRVSLDGRFVTVYPHAVVEDNFAFFSGRDDWKRLIEAYPTDAVLAPSGELPPLQMSSGWTRIHADGVATLFARTGSDIERAVAGVGVGEERPSGVFP